MCLHMGASAGRQLILLGRDLRTPGYKSGRSPFQVEAGFPSLYHSPGLLCPLSRPLAEEAIEVHVLGKQPERVLVHAARVAHPCVSVCSEVHRRGAWICMSTYVDRTRVGLHIAPFI